ncbi:DUF4347 domain-containing protein, partial [Rubripirellula amarantea]|uniref:DUF4347 domain-containing protein n=1 Tax=Rubripirellula amarantea TaxID=2527999 RepID=UPI0013EF36C9
MAAPEMAEGADVAMIAPADIESSEDSEAESTSELTASSSVGLATEIVIVDSSIPDLDQLLDDLSQSDRDFEVFVLDDSRDGVDQITEILESRTDVESVHVVSHSQNGAVKLGSVWLSEANLDGYAGQLTMWQSALTSESDLLFYGCDLASGPEGQALIESLAALTGADVAASNDDTGHADLGGDWVLEFQVGTIESTTAFSAELQDGWNAILATPAFSDRDEFLVNSGTTGTQTISGSNQAIAADGSGNYIVVWTDSVFDGDGYSVVAQRFDANGNRIGDEFQVNTNTTSDQYDASVAMNASGQFVIAFSDSDGGDVNISMRRFNADGTAIDATDVRVNVDHLAGDQQKSTVAINDVGQVVVAWESVGALEGIQFNAFDLTTTTSLGELSTGSYQITSETDAAQPNVSINSTGRFVVVWEDNGALWSRRYDHGNSSALSAKHSMIPISDGEDISVFVRSDNSYFVVYRSNVSFFEGIWARNANADGSLGSVALLVGGGSAIDPTFSVGASGDYVVTYQTSDGNGTGVRAGKFLADHSDSGSTFQVNQTSSGGQGSASVVALNGNDFAIVWTGNGNQTNNIDSEGVFARQYGTTAAHTITVTTTSTVNDGDVSSIDALLNDRGSDGEISLEEAIRAANNTTNGSTPDRINFNIAGGGPHVINLDDNLPNISDAVIIDGTSEPDFNGTPMIVLNGSLAGGGSNGFVLANGSNGSTIQGFVLQAFGKSGIRIDSSGNTIVGNYIGTDVTGHNAVGNNEDGIWLKDGATNNTIGGVDDASRNVISGNVRSGILIEGSGSTGNFVLGNYIGVDVEGDDILSNSLTGVRINGGANSNTIGAVGAGNVISGNQVGIVIYDSGTDDNVVVANWIGTDKTETSTSIGNFSQGIQIGNGADNNTIGGSAAGEGNVIADSGSVGIEILGSGTSGNVIVGNYIGTDSTNTASLGNAGEGILIRNGASNNTIGGRLAGEGNTITNSGGSGILVQTNTSVGNTLVGNLIGGNGGLEIALQDSSVSTNDANDSDSGPNDLLNYPVLAYAAVMGSDLNVQGTLHTNPSSTFTIDFYASSVADGSGHGDTQIYLGSTTVTTDSSGNGSFDITLTGVGVTVGQFLSATSTNAAGSTSELSLNFTSHSSNTAPVASAGSTYVINEGDSLTLDASATTDVDGDTLTYVWDLDNDGNYGEANEPSGVGPTVAWADLVSLGIASEGSHTISVRVSDGEGGIDTATATFTINNVSPTITSASTITVDENQTTVMTVTATDPADTLSYSITGGDDGSLFQIVSGTGVLTFVAAPDYDIAGDDDGDNVYLVQVSVSDGTTTSTIDISVTVANVNEAPHTITLN